MLGCATLLTGALPATRPSAVLPDLCAVLRGASGEKGDTMSSQPRPLPKQDTITGLRAIIADADEKGADRASLLLNLTHRDAALLKRSPAVAMEEISFLGGEMRFLGVKVEVGAVTVSALSGL